MAERVEDVVSQHAVTLGVLVSSMSEIKDTLRDTSNTLRKMEVLMERQSNHEEQTRASFERLHDRMDKHEEAETKRLEAHDKYCDIVERKADNGDKAYKFIIWLGIALGGSVAASLFGVFIWAIKQGA